MPIKRTIPHRNGTYFITFTCHQWLPLIGISDSYSAVYKWFDYLKREGHFIIGYQIMPNHLHSIIAFKNARKSINKIVGDGKRFLAYDIVTRLTAANQADLLNKLKQGVTDSDKKRGKLHEIWEDSFDWKECKDREMIAGILHYMHQNPCTGKWRLVENPVDYIHSSAHYYLTNEQGHYIITNYMELEDIDLTRFTP